MHSEESIWCLQKNLKMMLHRRVLSITWYLISWWCFKISKFRQQRLNVVINIFCPKRWTNTFAEVICSKNHFKILFRTNLLILCHFRMWSHWVEMVKLKINTKAKICGTEMKVIPYYIPVYATNAAQILW